jgi:hypothetical protein
VNLALLAGNPTARFLFIEKRFERYFQGFNRLDIAVSGCLT